MAKKAKEKKKVLTKVTASIIFEEFADKDGFVSLEDLASVGWTKGKAESEGLIVKETFRTIERV